MNASLNVKDSPSLAQPSRRAKSHQNIVLAGNPNSGKTTLFNHLTGHRYKVANYPGVTVEKKTGYCLPFGDQNVQVIDLPGIYSLSGQSEDEIIAERELRSLDKDSALIIAVTDAS